MDLIKTRLVGFTSKLRILADPLGYSQPPDQEESLAEFVERKFDGEILNNLVDPFISTIFLGDARRMGMESAFPALVEWERRKGSLLRGARLPSPCVTAQTKMGASCTSRRPCRRLAIEYAPICTVSSAYDRSHVANALDGLGFMVPRRIYRPAPQELLGSMALSTSQS